MVELLLLIASGNPFVSNCFEEASGLLVLNLVVALQNSTFISSLISLFACLVSSSGHKYSYAERVFFFNFTSIGRSAVSLILIIISFTKKNCLYQRLLQNHSACLLYCTNLLLRLQTCRWLVQGQTVSSRFSKSIFFFSTENKTDKNASLRFYVSAFSVCLHRDKYTMNDHEHQRLLN